MFQEKTPKGIYMSLRSLSKASFTLKGHCNPLGGLSQGFFLEHHWRCFAKKDISNKKKFSYLCIFHLGSVPRRCPDLSEEKICQKCRNWQVNYGLSDKSFYPLKFELHTYVKTDVILRNGYIFSLIRTTLFLANEFMYYIMKL